MPTDPEHIPTTLARKAWLVGCAVHTRPSSQSPRTMMRLNGQPVKAHLDSGSTITLVQPSAFPTQVIPCGITKVTCVHRDAREVATTRVQVGDHQGEWELLVREIPDLPVPLLIGKDCPRFSVELMAPCREDRHSRPARRPRQHHTAAGRAFLADGSEDSMDATADGESPPTTNLLSRVLAGHPQREFWSGPEAGQSAKKHCWGQVRLVKSMGQQAGHPLSLAYFLMQWGLLYYHIEGQGQPCGLWFPDLKSTWSCTSCIHIPSGAT